MGDLVSWLLFADTIAGRAAARRFAAAIDHLLDLPTPIGARARTDTHCRIVQSGTRLAVEIDDTVRALVGRVVTVQDGGARSITIMLTGADRQEVAQLADWPSSLADVNPWTDRPPRDGLGGAR